MSIKRTALTLLLGLTLATATVASAEYEKDEDAKSTTTDASDADSGELPTREEFVTAVRAAQGEMFTSNVEGMGIDPEEASDVYDEFIGCTYESIKGEPDVVRQAMDFEAEPDAELDAKLEELAADCQDTFNADMRALLAAVPTTIAPAGGAPTTVVP